MQKWPAMITLRGELGNAPAEYIGDIQPAEGETIEVTILPSPADRIGGQASAVVDRVGELMIYGTQVP